MMHRAWSIIIEVPYCFSRSYVKFQGHTALKIVEFDPNWAFPDCNSSLNSPMAMKCCTKLETTKERCPIVFQGHPSNLKVTRYKISPILTQKWAFPDYRPVAAFKSLRFALFDKTKLLVMGKHISSKNLRNFMVLTQILWASSAWIWASWYHISDHITVHTFTILNDKFPMKSPGVGGAVRFLVVGTIG